MNSIEKTSHLYYQPRLDALEIGLLREKKFDELLESVLQSVPNQFDPRRSGRNCVDRLRVIYEALKDKLTNVSILDLGCANGFFANSLALLGAKSSIGIDDNSHVKALNLDIGDQLEAARIDSQRFGVSSVFLCGDILQTITEERVDLKSDVVLCLSILHHLVGGYGYLPDNSATNLLGERASLFWRWVDRHAIQEVFFEIHENLYPDYSRTAIPKTLMSYTSFRDVSLIGESSGFEGGTRGIWRLRR